MTEDVAYSYGKKGASFFNSASERRARCVKKTKNLYYFPDMVKCQCKEGNVSAVSIT